MNEIILQNKNGQILANSRDVAEKFGKRHDSVLRDIDNLISNSDSTKLWSEMFIETTYVNSRGKTYRCFDMNRDGFSLLAMGFTGKEALEWKLKYIDTFNKMEEELRKQSTKALPTTYKEALVQLLEQVEENEKLVIENNHKQSVINGLTEDIPIYEKVDIINRICKKSHGGYADRYKELYKCFRENYHTDLVVKCGNYNEKQEKKKDHLTIIRYAEKFGYIDDLYDCCVKLYESEVKKVIKELYDVQE